MMANNLDKAPVMMTMELQAPVLTRHEENVVVCGGFSSELEGGEQIQGKADAVKHKILEKAGGNLKASEFVVEKYASQLVNGHNHKMKIRVGPGNYIHARLYEAFGAEAKDIEVLEVKTDKKKEDPLSDI